MSPIPASSWSSSLPAAPTNGTPCLSSWKPGASPTNIRSASGSPEPKTTWVRPCASAQRVQPATSSRNARSSWAGASSVTAATTSAATAAATECAGLPGGARHRERRELLGDLRRAAVGARDLRFPAHELLEVLLAAHANELVDGHRPGSLGTLPDGPQTATYTGVYTGTWVRGYTCVGVARANAVGYKRPETRRPPSTPCSA